MRSLLLASAMLLPGLTHAVSIQLVADNDFAVFAGNATNVTRMLYQNNDIWPDQIDAAASFSFVLRPGEDTLYLLALGGGGDENISGWVNGVNLASFSADIAASSDISGSLSNFSTSGNNNNGNGSIGDGTYSVSFSDVHASLASATWSAATTTEEHAVPWLSGAGGTGLYLDPDTAVVFRFDVTQVGLTAPVPEPSTYGLALGGLALVGAVMRRRKISK